MQAGCVTGSANHIFICTGWEAYDAYIHLNLADFFKNPTGRLPEWPPTIRDEDDRDFYKKDEKSYGKWRRGPPNPQDLPGASRDLKPRS